MTHIIDPVQKPVKQATLPECAQGLKVANLDLQRQTDAYGYLREVVRKLAAIGSGSDVVEGMPTLYMRFPMTDSDSPGEIRLDLNTVPAGTLLEMRTLFDKLCELTGESLLTAWDRIHQVAAMAKPLTDAAKSSQQGQ